MYPFLFNIFYIFISYSLATVAIPFNNLHNNMSIWVFFSRRVNQEILLTLRLLPLSFETDYLGASKTYAEANCSKYAF